MISSLPRPTALAVLGAAALLFAGCTSLSPQDRALLNQVKAQSDQAASDANAAKVSADNAAASAKAAQEAAQEAEAKANEAAERSGRMYKKSMQK